MVEHAAHIRSVKGSSPLAAKWLSLDVRTGRFESARENLLRLRAVGLHDVGQPGDFRRLLGQTHEIPSADCAGNSVCLP